MDAIKMKIDTGDHAPIKLKPYRTPLNQRPIMDKAIQDMPQANIIRPLHSSWSFPVLLVPKKDGGKRFCVDFKKLNKITKTFVWPLPHIDDILASLGNLTIFSSIDLKSGYWQVLIDAQDKEKTAFVYNSALYEFNSMAFGLVGSPAVFGELMTNVLEGISGKFTIAYMDDIIVFSQTAEQHLEHLAEVFARL